MSDTNDSGEVTGPMQTGTSRGHTDRQAAWLALSDLFLDSDVTPDLDHIEEVLLAAPFDLDTLERIFLDEVYPVCIHNLHMAAGHWTGFDAEWLFGQIERRQDAWHFLRCLRAPLRVRSARRMVPEWFTLRDRLIARGMR